MRNKKWSRIAFVFYMIFSFVLTALTPVKAYTTYQYLGSIEDYQGVYGSAKVGNFMVDGRQAFCLEHNLPTPPNGSSFVEETYYNERFKKALYYGYEGVEPWSGFKSKENGIVVTTLALSVIYSGWNSIGGQNQGNRELGVNAFLNYIDSKNVPNKSIAFEPENVQAKIQDDYQVSESITLKGNNEVSFTLPKDVTMVKNGQRFTGLVTIKGGESFYFEAPLSVTGKFESGVLKGKMPDYQPIVLRNKNSKLQDLGTLKLLKDPGYSANFSVNWVNLGSLLLKKVDENKEPVKDVTFNVSYQEDMQNSLGTFVTNENGEINIPNLKPGLLYLQEVEAPNHLIKDEGVFSCLIEVGKQTTFTKENQIKKGRIKIIKKDALNNKPILGSKIGFDIYQGELYVDTIFTDSTGVAISPLLPYGTYEICESVAPRGYQLNKKCQIVQIVENDKIVEIEVLDPRYEASIEINKEFLYPEMGMGDAKTVGAKYALYANEDLINPLNQEILYKKDELISVKDYWGDVGEKEINESGIIKWEHLVFGNYYVKETKAPEGCMLDEDVHYFKLNSYGDDILVEKRKTVYDVVMTQSFGIMKVSNDGTNGQTEVVQGVEFEVKLKSEVEKQGFENAKLYDHLITDEKGMAVSKKLPYGTYIVREIKTRDDLNLCEDFEITIDSYSENLEIIKVINNTPIKAYVKIVKKDANSGEVIQLEGVSFKIFDVKNNCFVEQKVGNQVIDTFITDNTGTLTTPLPLKMGNYEIVEIVAPKNYVILNERVPFSIGHVSNQGQEHVVEVEVKNTPIQGQISIFKKGETVFEFNRDFAYEKKPLANAEFTITSKKDILNPADGKTILYPAGQIVGKLKTDQEGKATSPLLPLGTYEVKEIKAPEGYVLDTKSYEVELSATNNNEAIVYSHLNVENARKKLDIEILKQDQTNHVPLDHAEFGLYANETIEGVFEKDQLLETLKTKNGKAKVSLDLPIASYYVKELKAPDGYIRGQEVWYIDGHLDVHFEHTFFNNPTHTYITKIDSSTKKILAGAKLQVTDLEGNIIDTWTSTNTKHLIKGLVIGKTYKLEELEAPEGYLCISPQEFVVEKNDLVFEIENKKIEGSASIIKKGLTYAGYENNKFNYTLSDLDDVEFGLFNKDDVLLQTKTTNKGKIIFDHLDVGEYYIQELKTHDGMVLDLHKYYFTVGKEANFEFEVINKRTQIQLSLKKILEIQNEDQQESYKDVEFGIYTNEVIHDLPKDTLVGTSKINQQGHLLETFYLENGNYYIKEIKTHPDYVLDENKYEFSVDLKNYNQEKQTIMINNGEIIENNLKDGSIIIEKKDEKTKEYLSGAVFSLTCDDGYEWARVSTDENGMAQIPCPYGKYILKEIEAPCGYKLDSKEYEIVVNDLNQVVKMEIYNKKEEIVDSGDTNQVYMYLILGITSLVFIFFLFEKRSKL